MLIKNKNVEAPKYNLGTKVTVKGLTWDNPCVIVGFDGKTIEGEWTYTIDWGGVVFAHIPESEISICNQK